MTRAHNRATTRGWSRRSAWALGSLVAAGALAGCGGSSGGGSESVTKEEVSACVEDNGMTVKPTPDQNPVATSAPGGALSVDAGTASVTLAFGESDADAESLVAEYKVDNPALNSASGDLLYQVANVAVLWGSVPTAEEQQLLDGCL